MPVALKSWARSRWHLAKKSKATIVVKRQTSSDKLIGATVTTSDRSAGKWKRTDARDLARRASSMVLWCAYFNSTNCAQHRMRLVRRSDAPGRKVWGGKQITHHKRIKRLFDGKGVGLKAASYMEDADGNVEEVADHPALDLLNNANPWQRGSTFSKACFMQWELYGRRYLHLVQKQGEIPAEMYPLYADKVRPIPTPEGLIGGYMYGRETAIEREFPVDEILWHQFFPSPFDPYGGLSPLHCVFQEADIYAASTTSELSLWNNGARPDFAVKVPATTTDTQLKQMRAEIESRHQGPGKCGDFWFFRDGEVTPLQFTQKEMEYLLGRQDIRAMIGAAYGIPETFWRMTDANLAGSQTAQEFYARWTVAPRLCQDAEEWSETLLALYGIEPGEYWFVYDDPVPENREQVRQDVTAFVMAGIWSKEYARELVGGRSPKEDGEKDPLDFSSGIQGGGNDAGDDKGDKSDKGEKSIVRKSEPQTLAEYFGEGCGHSVKRADDSRSVIIERIIKHWLDEIAQQYPMPVRPSDVDLAQYGTNLAVRLSQPIGELLLGGVKEGLSQVGSATEPQSIFPDSATEWINHYAIRLAGGVTDTTADAIRDGLSEGIARGDSLSERTGSVREALGEDAIWRAPMIARTETARAHVYGKLEAWKRTDVQAVKWVLAPGACPACQAFVSHFGDTRAPGEPFAKIGQTFSVPGRKPFTLKYETVFGPPLHPNDRCSVQPVLTPSEEAP